jgi:glutathione S-transferase
MHWQLSPKNPDLPLSTDPQVREEELRCLEEHGYFMKYYKQGFLTVPLFVLPDPHVIEIEQRPRPILYVHPARWDKITQRWASSDPECLFWQCALLFSTIPFDVALTHEVGMSPHQTLPFLALPDDRILFSRPQLVQFLTQHQQNHSFTPFSQFNSPPPERFLLVSHLSMGHQATYQLYFGLIEDHLWTALHYNWWGEVRNQSPDQMRFMYTQEFYPFPLNYLIIRTRRKEILNRLSIQLRQVNLDSETIYQQANQTLNAIAIKLGSSPYLLGNQPTLVDAFLFAFLHCVLSSEFPMNRLRGMIMENINLVDYARSIWKRWFRDRDLKIVPLRTV